MTLDKLVEVQVIEYLGRSGGRVTPTEVVKAVFNPSNADPTLVSKVVRILKRSGWCLAERVGRNHYWTCGPSAKPYKASAHMKPVFVPEACRRMGVSRPALLRIMPEPQRCARGLFWSGQAFEWALAHHRAVLAEYSLTAADMGVTRQTVHRWMRDSDFPCPLAYMGKNRWKPKEIEAWLKCRNRARGRVA